MESSQKHYTEEQAELLELFKEKAVAMGCEFFAVIGDPSTGKGASVFGTTPKSSQDGAARNARNAHIQWEIKHGIDANHDRSAN